MEQTRHHYGLFTTVTMIIGICIGSGIFFKSDNILKATGGSVPLGVLVFVLGATSIIFGGLCISELASRTDRPGGIITYVEEFASEKLACGMGWFQIFVYFPTIAAVVSWVVGIYICLLFGWEGSLENQMLIGFLFYTLTFVMNSLSARLGGGFQNFSTISKMIPLAIIAVCGLFFGNPAKGFQSISPSTLGGAAWLSAIGPIAYSFDGWSISTSIAPEIRDSKKNLPRALIIAPIIILITYVAYFIGVSSLLDPQKIIELQDAHVYIVAQNLFGGFGAQIILIFVILAVMGTANGIVLGYIRLPYSMAIRGQGMFPFAEKLSKQDDKNGMPVNSAIFCYAITTFWAAIHFITVKFGLLPNSDVSEISIVMSYIFYIILYYKVFTLYRAGEIKSAYRGVAVPVLATLGSLFILSGGLQSKLFFLYAAFCILVVLLALFYYRKHHADMSVGTK
ncbi:APC family permease [Caproiciproducens faecalis]|uniref:APC family permease n=1 Tax=Caproiciproducens faecalis TaxID=2820301 RepID=A0ABS7DKH8_9FIRM|nr:APC family permease [Caproiciproducens faecalis]MBW7571782.1 APC family permease [Caproiciproducens faecalis]